MNALTMRAVRDGAGNVRHMPAALAAPAPATRGRKKPVVPDPIRTNGESAAEQLRLFIERLERIQEEICGAQQDFADVMSEAKSTGYDTKGIRAILTLRKTEKHHRDEFEAILETYRGALGLL
jgi:uncharacterized protein (UPF0335 family)